MPMSKLFHILCSNNGRVIYEGRFQCRTRNEALKILREKIGRENLTGLVYTVTEFPIEVLKEIMNAISANQKIPEGDIVSFDKETPIEESEKAYANIVSNKHNPNKTQGLDGVRRRLGDL